MTGGRALASSVTAAVIVGLVVDLWMRWPGFLAVAIGALFGVASLIVTGSLATRGATMDDAWLAAAPDLHARTAALTDPDPARRPPDAAPSTVGPAPVASAPAGRELATGPELAEPARAGRELAAPAMPPAAGPELTVHAVAPRAGPARAAARRPMGDDDAGPAESSSV